jgi:hypothetical protein
VGGLPGARLGGTDSGNPERGELDRLDDPDLVAGGVAEGGSSQDRHLERLEVARVDQVLRAKEVPGWRRRAGAWARKMLPVRSAPLRSAPRRSAPSRSAARRSGASCKNDSPYAVPCISLIRKRPQVQVLAGPPPRNRRSGRLRRPGFLLEVPAERSSGSKRAATAYAGAERSRSACNANCRSPEAVGLQ